MATQIPPAPKRRRPNAKAAVPIEPLPEDQMLLVQLSTPEEGSLGPAITLPSGVDRQGLDLLANTLRKTTDDPSPFTFTVSIPDPNGGEATKVDVEGTLSETLAKYKDLVSFEQALQIECQTDAIFKVREISRCTSSHKGHDGAILCAAFSPIGNTLATGSGDNTARIWDLNTETPKHRLVGHTGWLLCVEWDPLGRTLATGSMDGSVRLWDPKTGKGIGDAMRGHSKWITSLAWEPAHLNAANPRLASASKDGSVRVWNGKTRTTIYTLGGHTAVVNVVRWSGEGVLYTASSDRTVKVWDAKDGKLIRTLSDHAHWVNTMALNTDFILRTGPFDHTEKQPKDDADAQAKALARYQAFTKTTPELLITGSEDHTLFLWSPLAPSNAKKPLARLTGHQKQVNHVAFSPNGRYIASAGFDNAVKLWDGKTGKFLSSMRGHVAPVYRLSWSSDSRMLISCSKDTTLKLWDLKTNKIRVDLPGHTDEVYCVDFVADRVCSGDRSGTLKLWRN